MNELQQKRTRSCPFSWSVMVILLNIILVEGDMKNCSLPYHDQSDTRDRIGESLGDIERITDVLKSAMGDNLENISCANTTQLEIYNLDDNATVQANFTKLLEASTQSERKRGLSIIFIIRGIISPIIVFPGIVCNIINMHVLLKQGANNSTIRYLIGLSIFDLMYLMSVLWQWVLRIIYMFYNELFWEIKFAMRYPWNTRLMILAMGRTSNLIILVISVERFVAVRFPFAAKYSLLTRHSAKVIICLAIFVFGIMVPNMVKQEYVQVIDASKNETKIVLGLTDYALRNKEFYIKYTTAILVILRLVPVASVLILNTAIIVCLKTGNRLDVSKQTTDDKRQIRQLKITRMLVAVAMFFLLCVSPGLIHSLFFNFNPTYQISGTNQSIWITVAVIYKLLDDINSTGNFFLYIFMSERFRVIFLSIFCKNVRS